MGMEYVPMLIVAHAHFHEQEIHGWARVVVAYACAGARGGTLVSFHGCRARLGIWSPPAAARLGFFFTPSLSLLWLSISLFPFSLSIVPLLNKY